MDNSIYSQLDKAWRSTCKIVFGEDIGSLTDYSEWLKEYVPPIQIRKSHLSNIEVYLPPGDYPPNTNFISLEEIRPNTIDPLSINEIKDIDSIREAISDKWEYCGNKVLGNSSFTESSDGITDSQYIIDSMMVQQSSNIFASANVFNNKYAFGCLRFTGNEFTIRIMRCANSRRCFESRIILNSSDIYLSCATYGCSDLMFSFNQRNKRNCIGNLQLTKDKYTELKSNLLAEIKEELKKEKKFPSLFEIVKGEGIPSTLTLPLSTTSENFNIHPVEKAFISTCKILFKQELGSLIDYEMWLSKHTGVLKKLESPFGSETYFVQDEDMQLYSFFPEDRIVSQSESMALGNLDIRLNESEISDIKSIRSNLHKIAYLTDELLEGTNHNISKTPASVNSSNLYKVQTALNSENIGICGIGILGSKFVFGCRRAVQSQFSMNCYNSFNLTRCFELDSCTNCSGCYFCHNCEGLQDSMFCFNTKGKRYAIGNIPLQPDKYQAIKEILLQQLCSDLKDNKSLKWDIFNIGSIN